MAKANSGDSVFQALYDAALVAGAAAGAAVSPRPMIVQQHSNPVNDASPVVQSWWVNDGVCGFGWVDLKGNTPFGRWAKKAGVARKGYPTGLSISSKLQTQSLARNEAWARGFAEVLRAGGVTDAYANSRID